MVRSKVKSRSHHDVEHIHPLTNYPIKYQLPTPYGFQDIAWKWRDNFHVKSLIGQKTLEGDRPLVSIGKSSAVVWTHWYWISNQQSSKNKTWHQIFQCSPDTVPKYLNVHQIPCPNIWMSTRYHAQIYECSPDTMPKYMNVHQILSPNIWMFTRYHAQLYECSPDTVPKYLNVHQIPYPNIWMFTKYHAQIFECSYHAQIFECSPDTVPKYLNVHQILCPNIWMFTRYHAQIFECSPDTVPKYLNVHQIPCPNIWMFTRYRAQIFECSPDSVPKYMNVHQIPYPNIWMFTRYRTQIFERSPNITNKNWIYTHNYQIVECSPNSNTFGRDDYIFKKLTRQPSYLLYGFLWLWFKHSEDNITDLFGFHTGFPQVKVASIFALNDIGVSSWNMKQTATNSFKKIPTPALR